MKLTRQMELRRDQIRVLIAKDFKHKYNTVSVIIPTLNAAEEIGGLIASLRAQTVVPDEIWVIDSDSSDGTADVVAGCEGVRVASVRRDEFNHGLTRDWALRRTTGDFVFFFTQDVVIRQPDFIARMLAPFADEQVAMVCARQIAKPDAELAERYVREFNYPAMRRVRTKDDIPVLGIKAFFHSDSAACYRRSAYLALGGFEMVVTNEDMLIAARALHAGWKTVYEGTAEVLHSHRFTFRQEFRRNRLIAQFLTAYPKLFGGLGVRGEGVRLVRQVAWRLLTGLHFVELVCFAFRCVAKFAGNCAAAGRPKRKGNRR